MFKTRLLGHRIHSPRKSDNGRLSPGARKSHINHQIVPRFEVPAHTLSITSTLSSFKQVEYPAQRLAPKGSPQGRFAAGG